MSPMSAQSTMSAPILHNPAALLLLLLLAAGAWSAWPLWSARPAHAAQPDRPDRPVQPVRLPACPNRPNCVITQAEGAVRDGQYIEPLPFTGEAAPAMRRLAVALSALPGCTVVEMDGLTVRAQCRGKVFGFIDDVVCAADPAASVVHLRSAARSGWWDFGVNRDRAEQLRRRFLGLPR